MLITIRKGLPVGLPSLRKTTSIRYRFQFKDFDYEIGTDQGDWNKLTGLKSNFFQPLKEAYMVVWRWYEGKLQLAFYHNLDGKFFLPPEESIITLPTPTTPFEVRMTRGGSALSASITTLELVSPNIGAGPAIFKILKTFYKTWIPRKFPTWEISFWFGGNRRPDQDISVYREKI